MAIKGPLFRIFSSCRNVFNNRPSFLYYQPDVGISTETKEQLKKIKIPEKPKKPMSPYFKFVFEHRNDVVKKFPNLKLTEITKKCAEDWKEAHSTIKEKYQGMYKEEVEKYNKNLIIFESSLSDEQRELMKTLSQEKKQDRKKRKHKKRLRETNKPKKPMGAFMIFALERAKSENIPYKDLLTASKSKWHQLSQSEKQKYLNLYESEKVKYETELANWEAKMIKQGNVDLVRASSLVEKGKPSHLTKLRKSKEE